VRKGSPAAASGARASPRALRARAQFAQGGGVTVDPGSAGSLWNLARQAAALYGHYGRRLRL